MDSKKRLSSKNGRWKGIPNDAQTFFITGYAGGLSARTLSVQWRVLCGERIDHRRIERWLKSQGIKLSSVKSRNRSSG